MPTIAHIFRHPIKSVGVEEVARVDLEPGRTLAWDRVWAIAHDAAKLREGWNTSVNFTRCSKVPALVAVRARVNDDGTITLTHPDRPSVTLDPA